MAKMFPIFPNCLPVARRLSKAAVFGVTLWLTKGYFAYKWSKGSSDVAIKAPSHNDGLARLDLTYVIGV